MSVAVPIVVVGFNRARALKRLLDALNEAVYNRNDVPLIISIDKGDNQDVLDAANAFEWKYGEKKVVYQKENLKLRKHILKCGDYAIEYGNVIILEDDLYVSKYFYEYTCAALDYSKNDKRIGGVSLYNHRYNVTASEPFEAIDDGYDNWYFRFASSWGEAWTKNQWMEFKEWYLTAPNINNMEEIPSYVRNWSESSWLKYFIAYLVAKDKYFIYPKKSVTTNFGEAGTHVNKNNTNHQVPLQNAHIDFKFSSLDNSKSIYDAYFESVTVGVVLAENGFDTDIDLYGQKPESIMKKRYILTRKSMPYKTVKQYACYMRPHEENILNNILGEDFFLYDTAIADNLNHKANMVRKMQYNHRFISRRHYKYIIKMFLQKTFDGLKRRIKKR